MDSAGGDTVAEHTHALEEQGKRLPEQGLLTNDQAHLDPSRWWFAASAFPMAAGTLGPVASAFSICALVRPWRQYIPPGTGIDQGIFIVDPIWLTAINAIQLAIAVVANMFLLLNMAKRVRFSVAQPLTIVGWYVSSLCLIGLTATAAGPLKDAEIPEGELVWSQAFYYGIYAAVLYMLVASLMLVTFFGALAGHYDKDFQLTLAQRTLMVQTIMLLMYLLLGALVFSKIEDWAYLDAVYWADVTLFTVGFGDFHATTDLGRGLLFPYALVGIVSLGLVIGSIRTLVLERGKHKLDARMMEKNRREFIRRMAKKGKDELLIPIPDGASGVNHNGTGLTEFERREQEFIMMRKIQHRATVKRRWYAMATSTSTWVVLWLVGAKIFQACEEPYQHWGYFDGVYFAYVSLTTIGYGDVVPISNAGRSFFVFWSLLALPTMTVLISNAGDTIVKEIRDWANALGKVTILPGEHGLKKDLKELVRTITCGVVFSDEEQEQEQEPSITIEERPPGFLGAAQPADNSSDEEGNGPEGANNEDVDAMMEEVNKEVNDAAGRKNGEAASTPAQKPTGSSSSNASTGVVPDAPPNQRSIEFDLPPKPAREPGTPRLTPRLHRTPSGRSTVSNKSSTTPSQWGVPITRRSVSFPRADLPQELPRTRAEYHRVLIDEIANVTQHLQHQPPRKYTFQEWAYYLKLIGEDEHSAETHRKPRMHVHGHHRNSGGDVEGGGGAGGGGAGGGSAGGGDISPSETKGGELGSAGSGGPLDENRLKWSWVGARSPLMSSQEEAEWILEKLTERLQAELRVVEEEEQEQEAVLSRASARDKAAAATSIREEPVRESRGGRGNDGDGDGDGDGGGGGDDAGRDGS